MAVNKNVSTYNSNICACVTCLIKYLSFQSFFFCAASLRVIPNRSQFFQYDSISISCGQQENSSEWRVKRNTSSHINTTCPSSSNGINESHCFISDLYPADSGVYWCESAAGECFDAVTITVAAGSVILESPVHPVMEGDTVILLCNHMTTVYDNLIIEFYKNELLIGRSSTGNLTIYRVSKCDEGLYKCNISGVGVSPDSWMTVRAGHPELRHPGLTHIQFPVACIFLLLFSAVLLSLSSKGKIDPVVVPYTEVIYTQKCRRKGRRLRKRSLMLSSKAAYRCVCTHTSCTVLTYKADS
uniref:Ig-like domain-containing protein n=1 Tax=Oreochromis niloticus TaxID=8128 RepID=A0A669EID2_ORENI